MMSLPWQFRSTSSNLRATSSPSSASEHGMSEVSLRGKSARILVVDDNPGIANLMSQLLTMRGYDVVIASDAQEAEAEVKREPPDLILSDVRMPGRSGYELCRDLKENPATRLIPFVLITGLSDSKNTEVVSGDVREGQKLVTGLQPRN